MALLPLISIPELETRVETRAFSETIHSRSYTHIIRNIVNDPSLVFDDIVTNEQILKRASDISGYYDDLIEMTNYWHLLGEGTHQINGKTITVNLRALKKQLYLCLMSVNALEAIRFYVSFACSFAFAERELMEGNAKIIRLIARDEALHLTGTQHMLNLMRSGEDDRKWRRSPGVPSGVLRPVRWRRCRKRVGGIPVPRRLDDRPEQRYSLPVHRVHHQYPYAGGGLDLPFQTRSNPIPWINARLVSDNVQVAPQEVEVSSYRWVRSIRKWVKTTSTISSCNYGGYEDQTARFRRAA